MNTKRTESSGINRRQFIKNSVTLPCIVTAGQATGRSESSTMKISRVEIFPVRYPMTGHFKFFTGPHGSKGRAAVLVKITADDGTVGWGQSVPVAKWSYETLETATIVLRDYFSPQLIGRNPLDIDGAHAAMDKALAGGFSTGMPISRAGLDVALHDLAGRILGKSLAQMWGRPHGGPLTLSWTLNPRKLDDVDTLIDAGWQRGYRNFNIKVAPDPVFDVALAKRVRKRVPKGLLWADANGGYAPEVALAAAPKLADAGVDVLEAPLKPNRISSYQALKKQGALPILMDEGVISPVDLAEFIRLKMIDGVAMKHSRCGGLVSARQQIELVTKAGLMWLGSGLTDPDISLAATLALYGAYGLKKPAALNGPQFLTVDLLKKPLKVKDGKMQVPKGPGLGIEVDEDRLAELVKQSKAGK
jgi:L-alanine-DL-glutamate epimerase-like enolase superfamily enzyme|tara:strand:- start:2474 stop:3724 length:1251 start_codon:yes stop_codon:yes gene_type:complete